MQNQCLFSSHLGWMSFTFHFMLPHFNSLKGKPCSTQFPNPQKQGFLIFSFLIVSGSWEENWRNGESRPNGTERNFCISWAWRACIQVKGSSVCLCVMRASSIRQGNRDHSHFQRCNPWEQGLSIYSVLGGLYVILLILSVTVKVGNSHNFMSLGRWENWGSSKWISLG